MLEKDTSYRARNFIRLMIMLVKELHYRFEDLQEINCPVLALVGENNRIKAKHTRGTLHIKPKETHYFPAHKRGEFNGNVLQFLKRTY